MSFDVSELTATLSALDAQLQKAEQLFYEAEFELGNELRLLNAGLANYRTSLSQLLYRRNIGKYTGDALSQLLSRVRLHLDISDALLTYARKNRHADIRDLSVAAIKSLESLTFVFFFEDGSEIIIPSARIENDGGVGVGARAGVEYWPPAGASVGAGVAPGAAADYGEFFEDVERSSTYISVLGPKDVLDPPPAPPVPPT